MALINGTGVLSSRVKLSRALTHDAYRYISSTSSQRIAQVKQLPTWDLKEFREIAYNTQTPAKLPLTKSSLPPAYHKWFIHDGLSNLDLASPPQTSELRTSFWSEHESTIVPLELTSKAPSSTEPTTPTFIRTSAPLKILLTYLSNPQTQPDPHSHSIYLAQCDLTTLPPSLQTDLPTPSIVTHSGKGDIYASSLWMGRPPTYTPLHRDPNPNLFLQLAGRKIVRLMPPEVGDAVFEDVVASTTQSSSKFRGEEMMVGPEKEALHRIVWEGHDKQSGLEEYMSEATLGLGEALFIPKGWWHSVKGVGDGVTASVNWWFR